MPLLPILPGFRAGRSDHIVTLGLVSGLDEREVVARMQGGNVPYLAYLDDEPVACGWSAWRHGQVGELGIDFEIPEGNRYLWDFVTLPQMRGRGIYPSLLQEILMEETPEAERFWIGHAPGNVASGNGILKAGFRVAGEVWIQAGSLVFVPAGDQERAAAAAAIFQIPFQSAWPAPRVTAHER